MLNTEGLKNTYLQSLESLEGRSVVKRKIVLVLKSPRSGFKSRFSVRLGKYAVSDSAFTPPTLFLNI